MQNVVLFLCRNIILFHIPVSGGGEEERESEGGSTYVNIVTLFHQMVL